ncbi:MAG: L,D-transpeptidase [Proteobacteria bacterium]|nr:L,D-transpeptidase [Pseudomonadota bacterium]
MPLLKKAVLAVGFTAAAIGAASAVTLDPVTRQPLVMSEDGRVHATPIPREEVDYSGRYAPGTIVVDTNEKRLYFVLPNKRAIKYGVGVGRPGFSWAGQKNITRKAEWPDWTPPPQMLKRRPDLPRHMKGGPENPMGARAMYLGTSLYRIHGSNEPETIGQAVSSGCIRMLNDDVVDLYERVKIGTRVVVTR